MHKIFNGTNWEAWIYCNLFWDINYISKVLSTQHPWAAIALGLDQKKEEGRITLAQLQGSALTPLGPTPPVDLWFHSVITVW